MPFSRARLSRREESQDCDECRLKAPLVATHRQQFFVGKAQSAPHERVDRGRSGKQRRFFPDPVGAEISTSRPARSPANPAVAARSARKSRANHSATRGSNSIGNIGVRIPPLSPRTSRQTPRLWRGTQLDYGQHRQTSLRRSRDSRRFVRAGRLPRTAPGFWPRPSSVRAWRSLTARS